MMTQYVYAGASQFSKEAPSLPQTGLCRQEVGESEWEILGEGLPAQAEIRAILIHPNDPLTLYVGTQCGPYRSSDGGVHWEKLNFPNKEAVVWALLFSPNDPRVMFCGTAPEAIYRSIDGGDTWTRLAFTPPESMVDMGFPCRIIDLAADPNNPDTIYAGLEVGGVARSMDGGDSWQDATKELLDLANTDYLKSRILSDTDAEGMMDIHALTLSPALPDTVFLATRMGLFRSDDAARSWKDMELWRASPLCYARDVQVCPTNPNTLYAALSPGALTLNGAVYRSPDLGKTWRRFTNAIHAKSTMMTVSPSRTKSDIVFCGTRKGQVFGTQDSGRTWSSSVLPSGCGNVYALACE